MSYPVSKTSFLKNNVLFVKYNKVTNQAILNLSTQLFSRGVNICCADIFSYGSKADILSYDKICSFLNPYKQFESIVVGDIFWQSGQNICLWAKKNNKKVYFLQHGQWIYIDGKKNPIQKPHCIFFFGDDICNECKKWPLGKSTKCIVTGNPRYDNLNVGLSGEYVYFSPPVIKELNKSSLPRINKSTLLALSQIKGIDKIRLLIQPHYREGDVASLKNIFPNSEFVDQALDPFPFIAKSECVLTHRDSTIVLDAIAHGKKIILMNLEYGLKSHYPRHYFRDFAVESLTRDELFNNVQEKYGNYEINERYVLSAKQYIYLGNASERVYNALVTNGT